MKRGQKPRKHVRSLLALLLAWPIFAFADTPCPQVSTGVSILQVQILNPPLPVSFASYDLETSYLTLTYLDRTSRMFIAVPRGLVQSGRVQYANIAHFHQAVMQERSVCPLLAETHSVPGGPIVTQDGMLLLTQAGLQIALQPTNVPYGPPIWSQP